MIKAIKMAVMWHVRKIALQGATEHIPLPPPPPPVGLSPYLRQEMWGVGRTDLGAFLGGPMQRHHLEVIESWFC